ncbi:MAG: PP2C family protein-serine/threonine phosphatase [Bacteroidota bacterium]|jgi:sigma-B regulation protein RsbU (phosphoserine phosphatase)
MKSRLIESRALHVLFVVAGALMLVMALLQLPIGIFIQYTRPGLPWFPVENVAEGIRIVPVVSVQGEPDARFQANDVLARVNEIRLDSMHFDGERWTRFLSDIHVGDTLRITLVRAGAQFSFPIILDESMNQLRGKGLSLATLVINNISPVILLLIGYVVLLRRPRQRQSALFFLTLATYALYMLSATQVSQHMPWWNALGEWRSLVAELTFMLFLPMLLHFLLVFPEEWFMKQRPRLRMLLVYFPYIALTGSGFLIQQYALLDDLRVYATLVDAVYVLTPILGLLILHGSRKRASAPLTLRVIRVVRAGMLAFTVGFILLILLNHLYVFYNILLPGAIGLRVAALLLITLALPVSFWYALLRYGFLDVHILYKRTTLYAILAAVIVLVFIVLFTFLDVAIPEFSTIDTLLVSVIVTAVIAIFIGLAKGSLEEMLNRRIFHEEYQRREQLRGLSRELLNILQSQAIIDTLADELRRILQLEFISVVEWGGAGIRRTLGGDALPDTVLSALGDQPVAFSSLEMGTVLNINTLPGGSALQPLNAFFCINGENGHRVCVLLGKKSSGRTLGNEELAELQTVAEHATLGWKNAALSEDLREQERIKQDVLIAQHIQTAMLPSWTPQSDVFDVAALALPAREVGGDFYDYISFPDGRLGLVVGDVSDKGVSAAMIMASTISTLRYAAEIEDSPRTILEAANRRLYRDTFRQMFAAVCFAVLDERTLEMRFTNAGLPKPLLVRDGEAFLIEWSENGSHYPLGMVQETEYHEESLQLQPDDVLVLYTDGIIEGTNTADEEFGIRRLRDTVRATASKSAQDILFQIITEAQEHHGDVDQYDDVTMMVLRVRA